MSEITDSVKPIPFPYGRRAEVHAELAATVDAPRYVSESADDALNDASAWVAIFGLAIMFVWFVAILVASLYGAYRFSHYLTR